jgi:hypothetical protein
MDARVPIPTGTASERAGTRWPDRLGHPAIGNLLGLLALLVAVSAGLGLLQQGLFWLLFSYTALVSGLLVAVVVARRRGRSLRWAEEEREGLVTEVERRTAELTGSEASRARAEDEAESCEAGYADLRSAVINAARVSPGNYDDFDAELAGALRRLSKPAGGGA